MISGLSQGMHIHLKIILFLKQIGIQKKNIAHLREEIFVYNVILQLHLLLAMIYPELQIQMIHLYQRL